MNESKTIQTLEKYYDISKNDPESEDDKFFVRNIEFDLAKSLMQEFGEKTCHKLAKMLLADEKQNEMQTSYFYEYPKHRHTSHSSTTWHEGTPTICVSPQTHYGYSDETPKYVGGHTSF